MLYIFYGENFRSVRQKFNKTLDVLKSKRPEAEVFSISGENLSADQLQEYANSQGLFDSKYIVISDDLFLYSDSKKTVLDLAEQLVKSDSIFLFAVDEVGKREITTLEKAGAVLYESSSESKTKSDFNIFALADALRVKDSKKLWLLLQEARASGQEAEAIFGTLWWQVKAIVLAGTSASANEAGLKPFVYSRAKSAAIKTEEAQSLLRQMVHLQTEAKTSKRDLWSGLELLSLSL